MIELGLTIAYQVLIMFLLIFVGFVLSYKKMLTDKGIKDITNILLTIVTPCVLIRAYQKDFDLNLAKGLAMAALFTLIVHIVAIVVVQIVFKKEDSNRYRIERFCSVYSNCGFMAIPLMNALIPGDGVFYGSCYLAIFTIFYWTHGVYAYTEDKNELQIKKALLTPGVIGTGLGILLFVTGIKLPPVAMDTINYLAELNTPLAMIVIGTYLVGLDIVKAFRNKALYTVTILRLILIPLIACVIAKLLNMDPVVAKSVMIPAACPVAAVASLFANKYGLDAKYSSELVSITTLISILTIPVVMMISELII